MPNPRIEPLKKVLAIDPNDEVAWFGLGKAYMEDGNFEEAATALRHCITVKPAYSAAYYALAQSLKTLHQLDECRLNEERRCHGDEESGSAESLPLEQLIERVVLALAERCAGSRIRDQHPHPRMPSLMRASHNEVHIRQSRAGL